MSTKPRVREQRTRKVRFLLRHRLAQAMAAKEAPRRPFFSFFLEPGAASVYRSASTGETFPASRAGRRHEMITVK